MGSLIRSPKPGSKGRLIFSNPHNLKRDALGQEIPGASGQRKNLALKTSDDEGKTWSAPKVLEEGASAYSDLALLTDGSLLCFYENKNVLTLARLNPAWLEHPAPQ